MRRPLVHGLNKSGTLTLPWRPGSARVGQHTSQQCKLMQTATSHIGAKESTQLNRRQTVRTQPSMHLEADRYRRRA